MIQELTVMNDVAEILNPLSKDERRRVVLWLLDYFAIYEDDFLDIMDDDDFAYGDAPATSYDAPTYEDDEVEEVEEEEEPAEPEPLTFATLYEQVAPKTAIQKIATAAWWLETQEGKDAWKSFEVNKLLKSIDVKVSSVSGTLAIEGKKDDPLVATLAKSGDSMQSRKTFRLSDAGMAFVGDRLA